MKLDPSGTFNGNFHCRRYIGYIRTCILTCIAVSGYRPSNHPGHHNLYRGQCTDYSEQCYRSAGRANQRCGGHDVYEFHSDQYRRSQHRSLF